MATNPSAAASGLQVQAATPVAGFALANGTPGIISWTAPSDGRQHRFAVYSSASVTSLETGGQVSVTYQPPGGAGFTPAQQLIAGGLGTGSAAGAVAGGIVGAGTTVFVNQTSALSAGAATVWAEIWGE